jgi:predicted ATP-grasp superfamily ATP-dependent carboligase
LIIETDDYGAVAISKHKKELERYYKVATAEWKILRRFLEKKEAYKIAQKSNVPHPKNYLPNNMKELEEIKSELSYPSLLKPVKGHEFKKKFNQKNFEVNHEIELLNKFNLCLDAKQEVMIQEIVLGPENNLYKMQGYINSKGKLTAKFFWFKLRQHPPLFGVGRVGVSTERNSEVEFLSEKLLAAADYKGYCSVEFKKDPKDGLLKLMEVNVRMPRNIWLAVSCGVNYPWIIYKDLVENNQIDVNHYKKNFYWIEIYIDLYNAIFHHKKEKIKFRDYIRPYISKNKSFAVLTISDFKPFLKQTTTLIRRAFRSLINNIK